MFGDKVRNAIFEKMETTARRLSDRNKDIRSYQDTIRKLQFINEEDRLELKEYTDALDNLEIDWDGFKNNWKELF